MVQLGGAVLDIPSFSNIFSNLAAKRIDVVRNFGKMF